MQVGHDPFVGMVFAGIVGIGVQFDRILPQHIDAGGRIFGAIEVWNLRVGADRITEYFVNSRMHSIGVFCDGNCRLLRRRRIQQEACAVALQLFFELLFRRQWLERCRTVHLLRCRRRRIQQEPGSLALQFLFELLLGRQWLERCRTVHSCRRGLRWIHQEPCTGFFELLFERLWLQRCRTIHRRRQWWIHQESCTRFFQFIVDGFTLEGRRIFREFFAGRICVGFLGRLIGFLSRLIFCVFRFCIGKYCVAVFDVIGNFRKAGLR